MIKLGTKTSPGPAIRSLRSSLQELARRIGRERMEVSLLLGYGKDLCGIVSSGSAATSVSPEGSGGVPDPPLPETPPRRGLRTWSGDPPGREEGVRFSGKTGTVVFQDQSRIGWLVGWVERGDGRVGVFSLRIRSTEPGEEFLSLRISLAKRYLALSGFALPEGL